MFEFVNCHSCSTRSSWVETPRDRATLGSVRSIAKRRFPAASPVQDGFFPVATLTDRPGFAGTLQAAIPRLGDGVLRLLERVGGMPQNTTRNLRTNQTKSCNILIINYITMEHNESRSQLLRYYASHSISLSFQGIPWVPKD